MYVDMMRSHKGSNRISLSFRESALGTYPIQPAVHCTALHFNNHPLVDITGAQR